MDTNDSDEIEPLTWTSAALRILREAPAPLAILAIYVEGFHPKSWSGSRAAILASRLPLLESLMNDPNPEVAKAAGEAAISLSHAIDRESEWEAKQDRERDERFDW